MSIDALGVQARVGDKIINLSEHSQTLVCEVLHVYTDRILIGTENLNSTWTRMNRTYIIINDQLEANKKNYPELFI